MKRTKPLAVAAGLVTAVVLVAGIGAASSPAASRHAAAKSAHQGAAAKVILKIWDIFYFPKQKGAAGAQGRAQLLIDQAFMKKYPNVTVQHVGVPGTDFFTDLRKYVASRSGPDIVTDGGSSFPANNGFSKAMYPMYKLLTKQQKAELGPYLAGEGIGDEAHYSMPNLAGVYAIAYNKALFKQAGIAGPPSTFSQLLDDCTKLNGAGILPMTNGFQGLSSAVPFYYGTSNQVLNPKGLLDWANFKIGWTDPRIMSAVGYIQQMAARSCFGDRAAAASKTDTDGFSAFVGGRGAMVFEGGGVTSSSFSATALPDFGVFAFPKVPTSVYPVGTPDAGYNANWSIMNYTKVCRTAWNWISFYESVPAQRIQWTVAGLLPVNIKTNAKANNGFDQGLLGLAANKNAHHGVGGTISSQEAGLLGQLFPELISGMLSPDQLAGQMQTQRATVPVPPSGGKLPNPPACVDGKNVAGG